MGIPQRNQGFTHALFHEHLQSCSMAVYELHIRRDLYKTRAYNWLTVMQMYLCHQMSKTVIRATQIIHHFETLESFIWDKLNRHLHKTWIWPFIPASLALFKMRLITKPTSILYQNGVLKMQFRHRSLKSKLYWWRVAQTVGINKKHPANRLQTMHSSQCIQDKI